MARDWTRLMTHRVVRFLAVITTAAAVVLAGIALNLGILSNRHWGPGGLTLGAAGVARTEDTAAERIAKPARTTTTRRLSTTTASTATSTSVEAPSDNGGPRPFLPNTPSSGAGTTNTTIAAVPVTDAPATTSPSRPRTTTTSTGLGDPQEFRVATWAKATAKFTTPTSLKVTAAVKRGWTVDKAVKSGRDVTMKFRNGTVEVTFHVWIKNGEIHSSNKRVKHDS